MEILYEPPLYDFQLLYDQHNRQIHAVALRLLKSEMLANEVVETVFTSLWSQRMMTSPNEGIKDWIFTEAKNDMIRRLKQLANEKPDLQSAGFAACPPFAQDLSA